MVYGHQLTTCLNCGHVYPCGEIMQCPKCGSINSALLNKGESDED